jgi:hypothetical protein
VNSLIESGVRQKFIHDQHPQFSVSQISRHSRFCLQAKTTEVNAPSASSEITKWLERADQTYALAVANGDSKNAVSAISAATRGLTALSKQLEKEREQEQTSPDHPDRPMTIADFDRVIKDFEQSGGFADSQWLYALQPTTLILFKRIAANPSLLAAVAEMEKTQNVATHN